MLASPACDCISAVTSRAFPNRRRCYHRRHRFDLRNQRFRYRDHLIHLATYHPPFLLVSLADSRFNHSALPLHCEQCDPRSTSTTAHLIDFSHLRRLNLQKQLNPVSWTVM